MANVGMLVQVDVTPPLSPGDDPIDDRLDSTLGHTMFYLATTGGITATDVANWVAANSLSLVVLTSGSVLADVGSDVFSGLASCAVLSLEGWTWDDDLFCDTSAGYGETSGTHTQVSIELPSHPMADSLTGDQTVVTSARKMNYLSDGNAAAGVTFVANVKGDSTKHCIWCIETGDLLADATAAPARRAGLHFIYDTSTVSNSTGWGLFDAAVAWLLVDPATTLAPSVTFKHNSTVSKASGQATNSADTPTLKIEMGFGTDVDTVPASWTDITADVLLQQGVNISRGRTSDLGSVTPGVAQFTVNNADRNYEPGFSGANGLNVIPHVQCRITANYFGVDWPLFYGIVEQWQPTYPDHGKSSHTLVRCHDVLALASQLNLDGGHLSDYILQAATGSFHWPLDELSGSTGREVIGTGGTMTISDKTLGDSTFATNGISRRQYPLKSTAADAFVPAIDGGHTGELTVMGWVRQTAAGAGGSQPTAVWGSAQETEEGTTCTPVIPTHAAGDVLVAFFGWDGSSGSSGTPASEPSGWTRVGAVLDTNDGSLSAHAAVYSMTAASASETNPTLTLTNPEDQVGLVAVVSGSSGVVHASVLDATITDETSPPITTGDDALILKWLVADGSDAPFSWASGTEKADGETITSAISYTAAEDSQATAGEHAAVVVTYNSTPPTRSAFINLAFVPEGGWTFCDMRNTADTNHTCTLTVQGDGGITYDHNNDGVATAGAISVAASSDINDGSWHHLAVVRTGSGTTWTVEAFLDGDSLGAAVTGPVETPWAGPTTFEGFGTDLIGNMAQISYLLEALSDVAVSEIYDAFLDIFPAQPSDERISDAWGYLGLPAAWENLGAGATTMAGETLAGQSVLSAINAAALSEYGLVFVDGSGVLRLHPRTQRTASLAVTDIGEGTAMPIVDLTMTATNDLMTNAVVVTYAEGLSVAAVDLTALARDGERVESVTINSGRAMAQGYADHLLAQRKDTTSRVEAVDLVASPTAANIFSCLSAELSDRINVNYDPRDDGGASADIDFDGFIESINWHIDSEWHVTWRISPQALSITGF